MTMVGMCSWVGVKVDAVKVLLVLCGRGLVMEAEGFLEFVNASPSPYHAVRSSIELLEGAGFIRLREDVDWGKELRPSSGYFTTRFGTSLLAFRTGSSFNKEDLCGFDVIGAHTDSPCFKVKPISKAGKAGYLQLGVETYGGGLWYSWFDRDLTVAGRIVVEDGGESKTVLVHVKRPLMRIASLAIHLNREANSNFAPNTETHTAPILATEIKASLEGGKAKEEESDEQKKKKNGDEKYHAALIGVLAEEIGCDPSAIKDMDLYIADSQPSAIGGLMKEFMFSPRLDNLASCYTSLRALVKTSLEGDDLVNKTDRTVNMICLFDHEEIGSRSAQGACSPFLLDSMKRIVAVLERPTCLSSVLARSFIISADMAHAVHPNYVSKHEDKHCPALHKGVVIKTNQNQRYATNGYTGFVLREIASRRGIPTQEFVVRNDSPCGSTIGPIIAGGTGIRTVDVGMPQLAMHSCREMCGVDDFDHAIDLFAAFFADFPAMDEKLRTHFE